MKAGPVLVCLSAGWFSLLLLLANGDATEGLALIIGTFMIAECLSAMICETAGSRHRTQSERIGYVLSLWVAVCCLFILLFHFGFFDLYQSGPFAALCMLGLILLTCLLKLCLTSIAAGFLKWLIPLRLIFVSIWILVTDMVGGIGTDVILAGVLMLYLALLLFNAGALRKSFATENPFQSGGMAALMQFGDLPLVTAVLPHEQSLTYLAARGLSLIVVFGLRHLGGAAARPLRTTYQNHNKSAFITMAARINLGFLLVGGGLALLALMAGPYIQHWLALTGGPFSAVLGWTVLAASAPALFGATTLLLHTTQNARTKILIDSAAIVLLIGSAFISATPTALFAAKCLATIHLASAALAAIILARHAGIWPGLTALLLRQIRLR